MDKTKMSISVNFPATYISTLLSTYYTVTNINILPILPVLT